jgi:hypothetical protein
MLKNIKTIIEGNDKDVYSSTLMTSYNNLYYQSVYRAIKEYDETKYHEHIYRIALINYKKYTFVIGMSYYTVGKSVVLIKLPISDEPVVISVSANLDLELFDLCYDICNKVSDEFYDEEVDNSFDVESTMMNFSKWVNEFTVINKGLHADRPSVNDVRPDRIVRISSDDDAMNMINEYIEKCENFYNTTNDKFEILMANVKTFDVGTVHTLEDLTNLVRFLYHEYMFNDNLKIYDDPFDVSEGSFLPECSFKFLLRQFDIMIENMITKYVGEDHTISVPMLVGSLQYELNKLIKNYNIKYDLKLYYDKPMIGIFVENNATLIYTKDLSNIVEVINTQEDNNYTRKFILYEEPVKDFFKDLIEETNFLDLYLGIIFTDPILIENFLKNEDNDNNDFF